jgi:LmbE family N-acetylglucosaminyl deacetylase
VAKRLSRIVGYNHYVVWIYLSPHFDDVALSCGGLVWEQVQSGELVSIWTICASEPPSEILSPFAQALHTRWETSQNATTRRRAEDAISCRRLGAGSQYFSISDCIYRRHPQSGQFMYASETSLNGPLHPGEIALIDHLKTELEQSMPPDATLICPLALGAHVDHQLTRLAAEQLGRISWYYPDFPYVLRYKSHLEQMEREGWESELFPITSAGLLAWQDSISAHASQISTFWLNDQEMRKSISDYLFTNAGMRLWRKSAR